MTNPIDLLDAIDLLAEAREMNEVLFMACASIGDQRKAAALQSVIGACGDTLQHVHDRLEALRCNSSSEGLDIALSKVQMNE